MVSRCRFTPVTAAGIVDAGWHYDSVVACLPLSRERGSPRVVGLLCVIWLPESCVRRFCWLQACYRVRRGTFFFWRGMEAVRGGGGVRESDDVLVITRDVLVDH